MGTPNGGDPEAMQKRPCNKLTFNTLRKCLFWKPKQALSQNEWKEPVFTTKDKKEKIYFALSSVCTIFAPKKRR